MSAVALGASRPRRAWRLGDLLELLSCVSAVQRRAVLAAEHEIVFLQRLPRRKPFGSLAGVVSAERLKRSARYRRRC